MSNVQSHWHHALEAANAGRFVIRNKVGTLEPLRPSMGWNPSAFRRALDTAKTFQRYVFTDEVIHLATKYKSSIQDLIEAGITDLPFPVLSLEFTAKVQVGFESRPDTFTDREPTFVILAKHEKTGFTHRAFWFSLPKLADGERGIMPCPVVLDMSVAMHDGEPAIKASTGYAVWISDGKVFNRHFNFPPLVEDASQSPWYLEMHDMGSMLQNCMVLLNTKGVDREVIPAPHKLNKHRLAAGKPTILDHTVVRIGRVYSKDGTSHEYSSTGRKMPIHLRAGHTRHQHYGVKNEKTKIVYIRPVLVNYDPDASTPVKPRVVK